jgi:hypothetical protein
MELRLFLGLNDPTGHRASDFLTLLCSIPNRGNTPRATYSAAADGRLIHRYTPAASSNVSHNTVVRQLTQHHDDHIVISSLISQGAGGSMLLQWPEGRGVAFYIITVPTRSVIIATIIISKKQKK